MYRNKHAVFLLFFMLPLFVAAQDGYSNVAKQTDRINTLAKSYQQYVKVKSIAKTTSGKDIWQITIGTGNTETKPAIAIVGGVEGNMILGPELAIGFAEEILKASNTDSIKSLLAKTTFYVFPNMSPDATEQYFTSLQYERQGNAKTTDEDRDGKNNEDGFEDLDNNGKITWMRVESPVGDYRLNPDDPKGMIKADPAKGEKGKYLLYTEGLDNDKDGQFNEDGEGGVNFNRNFSYKHPSFTPGSGEFAVSENESRALLDLLYELYNVYMVISFSSNNNLSTPNTFNALSVAQPVLNGWLEPDVKANRMVSDLYNKIVNIKDAPRATTTGGEFISWAYYHYGRYSFGTPGWWVPKTKPDSIKNEKAFTVEDSVTNYLRWAEKQGITNTYSDWKSIQHPDFPNQKVEVGGLNPFSLTSPPYKLVPDLAKKYTGFFIRLASFQPEVDIINVKTEKIGTGLTRVTVDIINKGALASHAKLGERTYWVKRINVRLNTNANQSVISGRKTQLLNSLEGYSTQQLTWLIKGNGKLAIEAGSPSTGSKSIDVTL